MNSFQSVREYERGFSTIAQQTRYWEMAMKAYELGNKIQQLPETSGLISKYGMKKSEANRMDNFEFDWEGGLSELKTQYTAVELQHKASDWR